MEVLLIEDSAGDAVLIRQIMAKSKLPVKLHIARDGEQALIMLADPNLKADLIILDLNIPNISGNALLKRYQSREVPIVVFSSTRNERELNEAMALGVRQYIQKPTDLQEFSAAVSDIVRKWTPGDAGKTTQADSEHT